MPLGVVCIPSSDKVVVGKTGSKELLTLEIGGSFYWKNARLATDIHASGSVLSLGRFGQPRAAKAAVSVRSCLIEGIGPVRDVGDRQMPGKEYS